MVPSCDNCEIAQVLIERSELLREKYNDLVEAYHKVCAHLDLMKRASHRYRDLYDHAVGVLFAEAEQYKTLPVELALPLLKEHGFKLGIARWAETQGQVLERHKQLEADLRTLANRDRTKKNIVPFPSKR
jgi:hypothetical protein